MHTMQCTNHSSPCSRKILTGRSGTSVVNLVIALWFIPQRRLFIISAFTYRSFCLVFTYILHWIFTNVSVNLPVLFLSQFHNIVDVTMSVFCLRNLAIKDLRKGWGGEFQSIRMFITFFFAIAFRYPRL